MSDQSQEKNQGNREIVVTVITWVLAIMLSLGLLTTLFWQPRIAKSMVLYKDPAGLVEAPDYAAVKVEASLPEFVLEMQSEGLKRDQNLYTEGDQNFRTEPINHVVVSGDSIWALSNTYGVTIGISDNFATHGIGSFFCDPCHFHGLFIGIDRMSGCMIQ